MTEAKLQVTWEMTKVVQVVAAVVVANVVLAAIAFTGYAVVLVVMLPRKKERKKPKNFAWRNALRKLLRISQVANHSS